MARSPAVPRPGALWSLRQVCLHADVPVATGKAMARLGLINPAALGETDVVVLKVAVAVTDLRAPGQTRSRNETVVARASDRHAVRLVRQLLLDDKLGAEMVLLAGPAGCFVETPARLAKALGALTAVSVVVPVGQWAATLPSRRRQEVA